MSKMTGTYLPLPIMMLHFSLNSIITRYLVRERGVSTFGLTTVRFLGGFAMLQLITFLFPKTLVRGPLSKKHLLAAVLLGFYALSISYVYYLITASSGVLIFYLFVVITMSAVSVTVDKEKLSTGLVVGAGLAILE